MSEVIERPLFRSATHALNWAYKMEHVSVHPSQDLRNNRARFNAWTDLSPLDTHAQAAFIRDMVETRLKPPEIAVIRARHGIGFTQVIGVHSLSEHVRGLVKNDGECLDIIVGSLYCIKNDYSKRKIANIYNVSPRSVEDDWKYIKGCIHSLEQMAYTTLDTEFRSQDGLIDSV